MLMLQARADVTLETARARLRPPAPAGAHRAALGAAALAALSALLLATSVILGPPSLWVASAVAAGPASP